MKIFLFICLSVVALISLILFIVFVLITADLVMNKDMIEFWWLPISIKHSQLSPQESIVVCAGFVALILMSLFSFLASAYFLRKKTKGGL